MKKNLKKNQKGFALLEYSAGAAVVATILWVAMTALGGNISNMLDSIGTWADNQSQQIAEDTNQNQ